MLCIMKYFWNVQYPYSWDTTWSITSSHQCSQYQREIRISKIMTRILQVLNQKALVFLHSLLSAFTGHFFFASHCPPKLETGPLRMWGPHWKIHYKELYIEEKHWCSCFYFSPHYLHVFWQGKKKGENPKALLKCASTYKQVSTSVSCAGSLENMPTVCD